MLRYLTIAGAVCAVVAPFLTGGATRGGGGELAWYTAGVVLAVVLGFAPRRWLRLAGTLLGLVTAVFAVLLAVHDVRGGLPGWDSPVLAVGAVGAAIGLFDSTTWKPRVWGVLGTVVVLAAAILAPWGAESASTRSDPYDDTGFSPAPVAEHPTGRQWSWRPPAAVAKMTATAWGVAVGTVDGSVTGVDGSEGVPLWRYARPGARVDDIVSAADGRSVLVAFASKDDDRSDLLVMLDAETGKARFEKLVRSSVVAAHQVLVGTTTMVVRGIGNDVAAYDTGTGAQRWSWTPPPDCTRSAGLSSQARTVVLAPYLCGDSAGIIGFDETTGAERWRHVVKFVPGSSALVISTTPTSDGAFVRFGFDIDQVAPGSVTSGLLDTATGRTVALPPQPWFTRADAGPVPLAEQQDGTDDTALEALEPATGTPHPLDVSACPDRTADATTARSYYRVCDDTGRDVTLVVQYWNGTPPQTVPVRLEGSGSDRKLLLVPTSGAVVLTRETYSSPSDVVGVLGTSFPD